MDAQDLIGVDAMTLGKDPLHVDVNNKLFEPVCIHHGGREFIASSGMAGIFLRRAQQLIDDGDAQLVPLLHRNGIDLLLVSAETPLSVHHGHVPWGVISG